GVWVRLQPECSEASSDAGEDDLDVGRCDSGGSAPWEVGREAGVATEAVPIQVIEPDRLGIIGFRGFVVWAYDAPCREGIEDEGALEFREQAPQFRIVFW